MNKGFDVKSVPENLTVLPQMRRTYSCSRPIHTQCPIDTYLIKFLDRSANYPTIHPIHSPPMLEMCQYRIVAQPTILVLGLVPCVMGKCHSITTPPYMLGRLLKPYIIQQCQVRMSYSTIPNPTKQAFNILLHTEY